VEGISHCPFTHHDVIRHELVARIVEAYDNKSSAGAPVRKREVRE
jgi:phosphate starvation-inducible protein PhoH